MNVFLYITFNHVFHRLWDYDDIELYILLLLLLLLFLSLSSSLLLLLLLLFQCIFSMFLWFSFIRTRPAKPRCHKDVTTWFREVERERGAGVNPSTGKVSRWFHGEFMTSMVCLQCKNCVIHTWARQRWASHNGTLYKLFIILLVFDWLTISAKEETFHSYCLVGFSNLYRLLLLINYVWTVARLKIFCIFLTAFYVFDLSFSAEWHECRHSHIECIVIGI